MHISISTARTSSSIQNALYQIDKGYSSIHWCSDFRRAYMDFHFMLSIWKTEQLQVEQYSLQLPYMKSFNSMSMASRMAYCYKYNLILAKRRQTVNHSLSYFFFFESIHCYLIHFSLNLFIIREIVIYSIQNSSNSLWEILSRYFVYFLKQLFVHLFHFFKEAKLGRYFYYVLKGEEHEYFSF